MLNTLQKGYDRMLVKRIDDFNGHPFLGNNAEAILASKGLRASVISYNAGECATPYYWKTATEVLAVISGQIRSFDKTWTDNDIIVVEPWEVVELEAVDDAVLVSIVFSEGEESRQEIGDAGSGLLKLFTKNDFKNDLYERINALQCRVDELQNQIRLLLPPEEDIYERFSFPWKAIAPGSNIVLYGGGVVGRLFLRQLSRVPYCHVVAICDSNPGRTGIREFPIIKPSELAGWDSSRYDTILIAIEREDVGREIRQQLEWAGIPSGKIKWINPARTE